MLKKNNNNLFPFWFANAFSAESVKDNEWCVDLNEILVNYCNMHCNNGENRGKTNHNKSSSFTLVKFRIDLKV
jgi:hypothetical protein